MNIINRIEEIKSRLEKATRGPWVYDKERHTHDCCIHAVDAEEYYGYIHHNEGRGGVVGSSEWIWINHEDGEFIAHSRSDIEFLISEIYRLTSI